MRPGFCWGRRQAHEEMWMSPRRRGPMVLLSPAGVHRLGKAPVQGMRWAWALTRHSFSSSPPPHRPAPLPCPSSSRSHRNSRSSC